MGHLIPGKLFNVKVTQFFVGFGRTLWSTKRGETEYGVKAIPLGGYCKLVGMLPPAPDQDPNKVRDTKTGMFAQLVDDARSAEYEFVEEADKHRLFYNKPWWQRVIIMGSGVTINLVIAFFLFGVVFMGYGVPKATTSVDTVSDCVIAVTKDNLAKPPRNCEQTDPESPAKAAGFLPGDRIVTFNGTEVKSWRHIQNEIRANGAKTATIVVERDGKQITLHPKTVVSTVPDLKDAEADHQGRLPRGGPDHGHRTPGRRVRGHDHGRRDLADDQGDRRDAGEALPRRPRVRRARGARRQRPDERRRCGARRR